jgi:hypothetical protein
MKVINMKTSIKGNKFKKKNNQNIENNLLYFRVYIGVQVLMLNAITLGTVTFSIMTFSLPALSVAIKYNFQNNDTS